MSEKSNVPHEWTNAIPTGRKLVRDGELHAWAPPQERVLTPDRLPAPVTVEHEYLAAILRELQAVRAQLAALTPPVVPVDDPEAIELREPAPKKRKG